MNDNPFFSFFLLFLDLLLQEDAAIVAASYLISAQGFSWLLVWLAVLGGKAVSDSAMHFDAVCCSMPKFYFGRFDIRLKSVGQLQKAADFAIIEINDAGSAPFEISLLNRVRLSSCRFLGFFPDTPALK